jgi:hypothetical protein
MNFQYSIICIIFAVIGSLIGTLIIHHILMTTNKKYIRIIPLAFVLALCTILLPFYSFWQFFSSEYERQELFKFNSLC